MIETDEVIMFPDKIMFRAMTQKFMTQKHGLINMRKPEKEVKNAKFVNKIIPLVNDHDTSQIIGFAENFNYSVKDKAWRGDVIFEKKHLSEDQLQQVRTLAKRDLSIEYEWTLKKNTDEQFKKTGVLGDQVDLLIHNLAWVDNGRCSFPKCGLDTKNLLTTVDSPDAIRILSSDHYKNILTKEKGKEKVMTDCDHKELKDKLVAQTLEIKTLTDSLEQYKKDNEKFVAEQKENLISLITEKTGKDAKHYKDKSNELLLELLEELKDLKKDGYPAGTNIDKDDKDIDLSILPGSNVPFSLEQFKPTKPTEETFKLVRVTE